MPLNIVKPVWAERNTSGVSLVGWKLRFYEFQSDQPKTVYEDMERTVPACQPVILNSNGEAILFAEDGDYTVRVYNTEDVLQRCYDMQGAGGSNGSYLVVDTVQAMRELSAGSVSYVVVLGYSDPYDGCGGEFTWIPTAENLDDGVVWFAPTSFPAAGRYQRRNATALTTRMAGDPGNLTSSFETLTRLAAATGDGDSVLFAPGTYTISASQTVNFPATASVSAEDGAKINTIDAASIVISGTFTAPVTEVFTGNLNVTFGDAQPLAFAEWFGALADSGETDNTDAFLALFASGALLVSMPGKNGYSVSTDISASIPGNAVFVAASDLTFDTGPTILIHQGIFSANGTVDFANIKAGFVEFTTLAAINATITNLALTTLSGNIAYTGDLSQTGVYNLDGSIVATGPVSGNGLNSLDYIQAAGTIATATQMVAGTNITAAGGFVKAKAGASTRSFKAAGSGNIALGTGNATLEADALTATGDYIKVICSGVASVTTPTITVSVGATVGTFLLNSGGSGTPFYHAEVLVFRTGATSSFATGFANVTPDSASGTAKSAAADQTAPSITWANPNTVSHTVSGGTKALTMYEIYPAS